MIHWNVAPEIGPLPIRWYGLFFALAFILGGAIFSRVNERSLLVTREEALTKYVIAGTLIGARLGHCLFYAPGYYLQHPLEILMPWKGGLASHGGAIGVVLFVALFCKRHRENSFFSVLDLLAAPAALAGFFIRMGNLMNSEIVGRPADLPWSFVFERVDLMPRHPAQVYEALCYLALFGVLYRLSMKGLALRARGRLTGLFMAGIFSCRFLIEFLKENQEAFEANLPLDMGQILSIPLILIGLFLLLRKALPATPLRSLPKKQSD